MNWVVIVVVAAVVLGILAWILSRRGSGPPPAHEIPYITLGESTLDELYGRRDARPLLGYLDAAASTVYVASRNRGRLKAHLGVTEERDGRWIVERGVIRGEFAPRELDDLDMNRPIVEGDLAVIEGHTCRSLAAGTCVNMVDPGGTFQGSFRTASALSVCLHAPGSVCDEIYERRTIDVYPRVECQGEPRQEEHGVPICGGR